MVTIGIALLVAGLFFDTGTVASQSAPTPTVDRLAQPTLPAVPSQADQGSQVYWLSCRPCHGDSGQGLTEEFRKAYPEEDQNCWMSGCHGEKPYENGFELPTAIPAVVGSSALQKFETAASLRSYIFVAMPYWKPASLTEEESWQVTAFLLRENNLLTANGEINEANASSIRVGPPPATSTPQPFSAPMVTSRVPILIASVIILVLGVVLRFVWIKKEKI